MYFAVKNFDRKIDKMGTKMDNLKELIPYNEVENKIAIIRKQDVIADADVAELYACLSSQRES